MNCDRLSSRRRRPDFDSMEERQLLTTFLMIDNASAIEGTGAPSAMTFTVKLVSPSTSTVTVDYATQDGSARAGSDYIATSGTLAFEPGQTVKTVSVPIVPDALPEPNETFRVVLSRPVNAQIFGGIGTGMIIDDDGAVPPRATMLDAQATRGLSGMRAMAFTISLNVPHRTPVSVQATTANLTAIAGRDYQAKSELLTFAPGETTKTFIVQAIGTPKKTGDVIFMVNLSSTTATLARTTAYGILRYGA